MAPEPRVTLFLFLQFAESLVHLGRIPAEVHHCFDVLQVAALDALALAPAAVQEAIQKRQEQQSRGEAAWESMMSSGGVGGGGTHLSVEVVCPSCGEKRAQVHTILSGGTYAQV